LRRKTYETAEQKCLFCSAAAIGASSEGAKTAFLFCWNDRFFPF